MTELRFPGHRQFLPIFFLLTALFLAGCVSNPATGEQDFTPFMSKAEEKRLGAREHGKVIAKYGVLEDEELGAYVAQLGGQLLARSEMAGEKFRFTLLDSPIVNAFALPGGYIYVTRGLMALANDESELVSVIGHEIGHVTARHSAQRYNRAIGANILSNLAGAIFGSPAGQLSGLVGQGMVASYSREQEFHADNLGLRYTSRSGYDPNGASRFLAQLLRMEGRKNGAKAEANWLGNLMASHPNTKERVSEAQQIAQAKLRQEPHLAEGRIAREYYLKKIDGMAFGQRPEQGMIRHNRYFNTGYRISMNIPAGFEAQVGEKGLIAHAELHRLRWDVEEKPKYSGAKDYLARQWARNTRLEELQTLSVNGMSGARATARLNSEGKQVQLHLAVIKGRKGAMYRYLMVSPDGQGFHDFRDWVSTSHTLSPAEAERIQPLRIRLHRVGARDTVARLARKMALSGNKEAWLRLLNGMDGDDELKKGQLIKLVSDR